MNQGTLLGRLTAEPELKSTNSGTYYCRFTLAVDSYRNGETQSDFIPLIIWGKSAESFAKYMEKGRRVLVSFTTRMSEKYEDRNGNTVYPYPQLMATKFWFADGSKSDGNGQKREPQRGYNRGQGEQGFQEPFSDEIPF